MAAHSLQTYQGRSANLKDPDLAIFMGFAIKIIRETSEFGILRHLAAEWQPRLVMYTPGGLNLKLDELLKTPAEMTKFQALLEAITAEMTTFRGIIPEEVLKKTVPLRDAQWTPFLASLVNDVVRAIQRLVEANSSV